MLGHVDYMRTLILAGLLLCGCLSLPGCSGEPEYVDVICEETAVVSFDNRVMIHEEMAPFQCGFHFYESMDVEIEVIGNNDFPVDVITTSDLPMLTIMQCVDFDYYSNLTEFGVVNTSLVGEVEGGWNYVMVDVPYSCDTPLWENTTSIITGSDLWSGNTYGSYLGVLNSTSYYPVFIEEGRSATVKLVGGDDLSRFYPGDGWGAPYFAIGDGGGSDLSLYVDGYTYIGYVYTAQSDEWRISFSGDVVGGSDVLIQEVKGVATFDVRVTVSCDCEPTSYWDD